MRLLARLYPTIRVAGPDPEPWQELARKVNPAVELTDGGCDYALSIGDDAPAVAPVTFHLGSEGWDARFSTRNPQSLGDSPNPLGAGAAACLGAAAIFRAAFLEQSVDDADVAFSTLALEAVRSPEQPSLDSLEIPPETVLLGLGAVGNGALWAIGRAGVGGTLQLIDPEPLDAGNLQRYVLAVPGEEGRAKVELARDFLGERLDGRSHRLAWAEFLERVGRRWSRVLVALDSAADRRAAQAALPRWIANAWTQPGDLGVSVHPWRKGACLTCLYLPQRGTPNEDQLVSAAMGFEDEAHLRQVRELLATGTPPSRQLLQESAAALGIDPEPVLAYAERPLREFYSEGICGGAAVPLDRVGVPERSVHVPLVHQSALAGILLASRLFADLLGLGSDTAQATRIDLMRPLHEHLTRPVAKDEREICICQDQVYVAAYDELWDG